MIKLRILPNWRTGSFLSRILRVIFEKPQTKKLVGLGLAVIMTLAGLVAPRFGLVVQAHFNQEIIIASQKVLTTEHTFQDPVIGVISQGYSWYHQGIDFADNNGAPIKAIADGKVVQKGYQFFGYGNFIVIDHGNGFESMYAHMSEQSKLAIGQDVDKDAVLGYVGSTGRSTGPHLHLEVAENGRNINPYTLIEKI